MRILVGSAWRDGFLDYHRRAHELRIEVHAYRTLIRLEDLYFVRPRSPRLVLNYLRALGVRPVLRKISSRLGERYRNEKTLSCGWGRVLEAPPAARAGPGAFVAFIAPSHPVCVERIVLPPGLVLPVSQNPLTEPTGGTVLYHAGPAAYVEPWRWLAGWSEEGGVELPEDRLRHALEAAHELLTSTRWADARRLGRSSSPPREARGEPGREDGRPRAVLFGYGNYAKTVILPEAEALAVRAVHEVDPTQIPLERKTGIRWDTAPGPRVDETYDVSFVAGFHHTHAPLAIEALRRGAHAVVEKPIATTRADLDALVASMHASPGELFSCFQRRYLTFNDLAREDLRVAPGEPLSYHCLVYEVPLPTLHWYRWPASRSRLISNGCHWLDHFLFLNDFAEARVSELALASDGTVNCSVTLENDAFFTMVLTDRGSERLGVRDHVELRANGVTVVIDDGVRYRAEDARRIIRRERIGRMSSYRRMYRQIAATIRAGGAGDSPRSVAVSAGLAIALDKQLETRLHPPGVG